ncbi:MAG: hypothetical protein JJT85_13165 [Chromatiales bacterium]|nr:hypothetical protein [Chromatiales bacterium]
MKSNKQARKAVPEFERARYVAWLLRLDPFKVYQIAPDATEDGNQHLVDCVFIHLSKLVEKANHVKAKPGRKPARFHQHMRTLHHCCDVMDGTAEPPAPNEHGEYENTDGYRCPLFLLEGGDV